MVRLEQNKLIIEIDSATPSEALMHLQRAFLEYWQRHIEELTETEYTDFGEKLMHIAEELKQTDGVKNRGYFYKLAENYN